jgi:hypothetical protein
MDESKSIHVKDMATQHGDGRVDRTIQDGKCKRYSKWSAVEEQALLDGLKK